MPDGLLVSSTQLCEESTFSFQHANCVRLTILSSTQLCAKFKFSIKQLCTSTMSVSTVCVLCAKSTFLAHNCVTDWRFPAHNCVLCARLTLPKSSHFPWSDDIIPYITYRAHTTKRNAADVRSRHLKTGSLYSLVSLARQASCTYVHSWLNASQSQARLTRSMHACMRTGWAALSHLCCCCCSWNMEMELYKQVYPLLIISIRVRQMSKILYFS